MLRRWISRSICRRPREDLKGGAKHSRLRCRAVKSTAQSKQLSKNGKHEDTSSEGSSNSEDALVKGDELPVSASVQDKPSENDGSDRQCLRSADVEKKLVMPLSPVQEPQAQATQSAQYALAQYMALRHGYRLQTILEESNANGEIVVDRIAKVESVSSPAAVEHHDDGEDSGLRSDDLDSQAIFATDTSSSSSKTAKSAAENPLNLNAKQEETALLTADCRAVDLQEMVSRSDSATHTGTRSSASVSISNGLQLTKCCIVISPQSDELACSRPKEQQQRASSLFMLEKESIQQTDIKIPRDLESQPFGPAQISDSNNVDPDASKRSINKLLRSPLSNSTTSSTSLAFPEKGVVGIICDLPSSDFASKELIEPTSCFAEPESRVTPEVSQSWHKESQVKSSSASHNNSKTKVSQTAARTEKDKLPEPPQSPARASRLKMKLRCHSTPKLKKPDAVSDMDENGSTEEMAARMMSEAVKLPHLGDESVKCNSVNTNDDAAAARGQAAEMPSWSYSHNHGCYGYYSQPSIASDSSTCCCCTNEPHASSDSNLGDCNFNSCHHTCTCRMSHSCRSAPADCCSCCCCCWNCKQSAYIWPPYDPPNRYVNPHSPSQFGMVESAAPLQWSAFDPKSPTTEYQMWQNPQKAPEAAETAGEEQRIRGGGSCSSSTDELIHKMELSSASNVETEVSQRPATLTMTNSHNMDTAVSVVNQLPDVY